MKEETPPDTKQKKKKSLGLSRGLREDPSARETRRKFRSARGQLPDLSYRATVVKASPEMNEVLRCCLLKESKMNGSDTQ
ncbi:hypothetical protein TNCT_118241 [Trichonephila clavata]|uniref:Uncharacterized protein n=1 Tax=Trichonephila clavata TaxID=2740835 RepID=A0A8X6LL45_TRICU|nr:hypothetical protein TNCT_118241 [Trichonephila clavata]